MTYNHPARLPGRSRANSERLHQRTSGAPQLDPVHTEGVVFIGVRFEAAHLQYKLADMRMSDEQALARDSRKRSNDWLAIFVPWQMQFW